MTAFAALSALDRSDLFRLAELLEAGLLKLPVGSLALHDHVPATHAEAVSKCLDGLARDDLAPDQLALVLRAFAAGREAGDAASAQIEVVVTGRTRPRRHEIRAW